METILNGKYTESQAPEVLSSSSQLNLSDQQIVDRISPIFYSRDRKDWLILEYILKTNIYEKRNVRVEDLMVHMGMSNPSISVRLRKMRELTIEGAEFPLVAAIKSGNALLYYFPNIIDNKKALSILQHIMARRGFSYSKYAADKGILPTPSNNVNESEEFKEEPEDIEIEKIEDFWCQENQDFERSNEDIDEEKEEINEEIERFSEEQVDENQDAEKINFDKLATSLVTMGEVLEMLDETSNTLIEDITAGVTEIFNEKITQLNNRIAELEKKLSSSQIYNNTQESTEELLARARLLVRQKIFTKKDK